MLKSKQTFDIDIEDLTSEGDTILHLACLNKDTEVFRLIRKTLEDAQRGIDLKTKNSLQLTPLEYVCTYIYDEFAYRLLNRNPDLIHVQGENGMNVLHYACYYGHITLLKWLWSNKLFGIDVNAVDTNGRTPAHYACYEGYPEIIKFLFENPEVANIDYGMSNVFGNTPLHTACMYKNLDAVKLILEHSEEKKIDVTKVNNSMRTAEDIARIKGFHDIIELFDAWHLPSRNK